MTRTYWCPAALTPDGWRDDVTLAVDDAGWIQRIDSPSDTDAAERLTGPVVPGMPNLHSHAHQRAMAGLAEKAASQSDSFWTWREAMYHTVTRIGPDHLAAIARQLYVEMLKAGYTSVAEFQYLHHDVDGRPYRDPAEMTLQCLAAASAVGIGFTALPVLYRYGGFGGVAPGNAQKRFINDEPRFARIVERLLDETRHDANAAVGIAPHSLRAVDGTLLNEVLAGIGDRAAAVHIHIAEQRREVDDCLEHCGQRPVEWLLDHVNVDRRWCLVHATHMTDAETDSLAASGAVAGLCPTTEANLGDGFFNAPRYLAADGCFGIGSDSQISVSPVEELRWLEYGVRLSTGTRNALASSDVAHTGQRLWLGALAGGARATGRRTGVLEPGARADFLVLDANHPRLYGRRGASLVDCWIFSGNDNVVRDVFVGGRQVVFEGHHREEESIARDYRRTLDQIND